MKRKHSSTDDAVEEVPESNRVNPLIAARTRKFLHELTAEQCHPQLQSPLFGKLPAELRNAIFDLAVRPYNNNSRPLAHAKDVRIRKGPRSALKLDIALLLTCKRVYVETAALPLRNTSIQVLLYSLPIKVPLGVGEFRRQPKSHFLKMVKEGLTITKLQYVITLSSLVWTTSLGLSTISMRHLAQLSPKHFTLTIIPALRIWKDLTPSYLTGLRRLLERKYLPSSVQSLTLEVEIRPDQLPLIRDILREVEKMSVILSNKSQLQKCGDAVVSETYSPPRVEDGIFPPSCPKGEIEIEVYTLKWAR